MEQETIPSRLHRLQKQGEIPSFIRLLDAFGQSETLSYSELIGQSEVWACALFAQGLKPGDRVILILQHSTDLYTAFCGALIAGIVPTLFAFPSHKVSEEYYFESIDRLVDSSRAKLIVVYEELAQKLQATLREKGENVTVITKQSVRSSERSIIDFRDVDPDETAFLQYSSGTTGLKKGVAVSHRALLWQIDRYAKAIQLQSGDLIISWLPLYHDMGLIACLFLPILTRTPLVAMSPLDWVRQPAMLFEAIGKYRATLCWWPNFAYNFLAKRVQSPVGRNHNLCSLRGIVNCSEPIMYDSHAVFYQRFRESGIAPNILCSSYAMAENTFAVTSGGFNNPLCIERIDKEGLEKYGRAVVLGECEKKSVVLVSSGVPLDGIEVKILGEDKQVLPDRYIGQIAIRSPCLFRGYEGNVKETSDAVFEGMFLTGDVGYLAEGQLYVIGRKKEIIISAGKNIFPQDIEAFMNDVEGVIPGRTVAFGVADAESGTENVVVIAESHAVKSNEQDALRTKLFSILSQRADISPSDVIVVEPSWLIKSTSGKISRAANREKYLQMMARKLSGDTPSTQSTLVANDAVTRVKKCVLHVIRIRTRFKVDTITNDSPLISSGIIDSLSMAELLVSLEDEFKITIPADLISNIETFDSVIKIASTLNKVLDSRKTNHQSTENRANGWQAVVAKTLIQGEGARKYRIAPQLLDAERIPTNMHSELGRLGAPNYHSNSINTDNKGFRIAMLDGKSYSLDDFAVLPGKKGVILGNSVSFGVGASHDRNVFANVINDKLPGTYWYNLSLRASDLAQERRSIEIYGPPNIDYIIWFTGLNSLNYFLVELADKLRYRSEQSGYHDSPILSRNDWNSSFAALLEAMQKEIAALASNYKPKSTILFCLQPMLTWIGKQKTAEEAELITIFDTTFNRPLRRAFPTVMKNIYKIYVDALNKICEEEGIDFIDMNAASEMRKGDSWLFIDRVHLADMGHSTVGDILIRWIRSQQSTSRLKKHSVNAYNPAHVN